MASAFDRWGVPAEERFPLGPPSLVLPPTRVDRRLRDGDDLGVEGRALAVVHTPGHTAGSICIVDQERGIVFTSDTLLPTIYPGLRLGGPQDDPVTSALASLDRLAPFDRLAGAPGHGQRFAPIGPRRRATRAHILRRVDEVAAAVAQDPSASVWRIATRLTWSAGWSGLRPGFARWSALAQTEMYAAVVRAPEQGRR